MCLVVDMAILGCSEPWLSCILTSPLSGCSDLWSSLLGCSELWVYGILTNWVFGCPDSWLTVPLDLRILQHTWISGSLCGCLLRAVWFFGFFLGSHGTLVAVSAPLMMPLRDSDIPMHVPFTFCNKQHFTLSSFWDRVWAE